MGKPTGFLEFTRQENRWKEPLERIRDFEEFKLPLNLRSRTEQAARCMNCGVPFCQSGEYTVFFCAEECDKLQERK